MTRITCQNAPSNGDSVVPGEARPSESPPPSTQVRVYPEACKAAYRWPSSPTLLFSARGPTRTYRLAGCLVCRRVISFLWLTRRAGPWDMWVVTMSSLLVLGGVVLFAISPTLGYVPVLPLLVGVIGVILARGRLGNSWAVSLRYPESTQEPGACARKHWTTKRDKEDYECQP
jgi:hypothetical protein